FGRTAMTEAACASTTSSVSSTALTMTDASITRRGRRRWHRARYSEQVGRRQGAMGQLVRRRSDLRQRARHQLGVEEVASPQPGLLFAVWRGDDDRLRVL